MFTKIVATPSKETSNKEKKAQALSALQAYLPKKTGRNWLITRIYQLRINQLPKNQREIIKRDILNVAISIQAYNAAQPLEREKDITLLQKLSNELHNPLGELYHLTGFPHAFRMRILDLENELAIAHVKRFKEIYCQTELTKDIRDLLYPETQIILKDFLSDFRKERGL